LKRPHLTAIVAMTRGRVIGRAGQLPWHLPEDLAFFKRTTLGHAIVMGRKTYESIGKPLPKRRNIVLTRQVETAAPDGIEIVHGHEELLALPDLTDPTFVIGGAEVFRAFAHLLDEWLVTHVFEDYPGDTFLPPFEDEFPRSEGVSATDAFEIRRHFR
jgi:dihydrofolate reductase